MESAKKVREYYQSTGFEKSVKKVIDALSNEPFGMQINQIMTVCQLSNKTTREVLEHINAFHEDGYWFNSKSEKVDHECAVIPQVQPAEIKPQINRKPYSERTENELREMPLGRDRRDAVIVQWKQFGIERMMDISGASKEQLILSAQELVQRSMFDPVRQAAKDFLDSLDRDLMFQKEKLPVEPEVLPKLVNKNSGLVKKLPNTEEAWPTTKKADFSMGNCKNMIKTVVTRKSEIFLDGDQIVALLQQFFELDEIRWEIRSNKIIGVQLSKVEEIAA